MPIFEYKCSKCGYTMEFLEKAGSKRKHICRRCQSSDLKKLFSGFSVGQGHKVSSRGNGSCPTGTCPLT